MLNWFCVIILYKFDKQLQFLPAVEGIKKSIQRRIQDLVKHLRWSFLRKAPFYIPCRGGKMSGKIFVGEKFSHQFLKLKGLSWVGLLFFQRKVVLLVWDFSKWAWRSALLLSLIHGTGCCKYTPSWISQNKKFLYKLIFRNYKIFIRIPGEF